MGSRHRKTSRFPRPTTRVGTQRTLSRVPNEVTLSPEVRGPLSVYPVEALRRLKVDAFVTDRFGGVSHVPYDSLNLAAHVGDDEQHVTENRRRVAQAVGVEFDHLVTIRQVHGNRIVEVAD